MKRPSAVALVSVLCSIFLLGAALNGCATMQRLTGVDAVVTLDEDVIAACRMDDALYFLAIARDGSEHLLRTRLRDDGTWTTVEHNVLSPLDSLQGGKPALAQLEDGSLLTVFPAHRTPTNVDLVECRFANGTWSPPRWMDELNSPAWDSQPALSPDGTLLLFVSDRPGGRGGKDIYVSSRLSQGWSKPSLAGISTTGDDITPALMADSTLLFARQRDTTFGDYELFIARPSGPLQWSAAQPLPSPISSPADELAPVVWDSLLVFSTKRSSTRFSIAQTRLCGPVTLHVVVHPSSSATQLEGTLTVASSALIESISIGDQGRCTIQLNAGRQYLVRYTNRCSNAALQWGIHAPCDPLRTVLVELPIVLPDEQQAWETTLTDAFFPDDYYPATEEHRIAVALLAGYNIATAGDLPASFDSLAIEEVVGQLAARAACAPNEQIVIEIGASPPEVPIRYWGAPLYIPALGGSLRTGELLALERAALLRAYIVQQLLNEAIKSHPLASRYQARIHWHLAALDASGQSLRIRIAIGGGHSTGWQPRAD